MYALSIHQPYAELIRLGVKTWETGRSWRMPDHVIGQRIAICSTAAKVAYGWLSDWEDQGLPVAGWHDWVNRSMVLAFRDDDAPSSFERGAWTTANTTTHDMPLGVVRCTATVAECLPVVGYDGDDHNGQHRVFAPTPDGRLYRTTTRGWGPPDDISDQLPYGIWTPGTWATRLVDVRPTDPIPVKGKQRLWHLPADVAEAVA